MTGFVSSSLRDAVAFVILIAVLYFRPLGLFGSYRA
jgi:branched-subunit amino acid ABC-type transport system permease component